MRKRNNQGFSLVELLIGMAIMVLILAGVASVLSTGLQGMQFNLSMGAALAPGRNAANVITDRLRYNATTISYPAAGEANKLYLTYSDGTDEYTISRNSSTNTIVITKNGAADPTNPTMATGFVTGLSFSRGSDIREITVEITLKDPSNANAPSKTTRATVLALNVKIE